MQQHNKIILIKIIIKCLNNNNNKNKYKSLNNSNYKYSNKLILIIYNNIQKIFK